MKQHDDFWARRFAHLDRDRPDGVFYRGTGTQAECRYEPWRGEDPWEVACRLADPSAGGYAEERDAAGRVLRRYPETPSATLLPPADPAAAMAALRARKERGAEAEPPAPAPAPAPATGVARWREEAAVWTRRVTLAAARMRGRWQR
jgi:hypothetical protein